MDLTVVGGVAYLANEAGLELVSVTDPFHPYHLGYIQLQDYVGAPNGTGSVAVSGTIAYVTASWAGLDIVDVSNPSSPTLIGNYNSGGNIYQDVAIQGNLVYIADGSGLRILDISDPIHPAPDGYYPLPGGQAKAVAISGTLGVIADGSTGIYVLDVSNPANPILAGNFNTPGYAHHVFVDEGRIYVADDFAGLLILEPGPGIATDDHSDWADDWDAVDQRYSVDIP
jgi:hypothetical protein